MAGEKYADRAVATLATFVEANLPTQLRAVETAQSLTTNSLTDPVAYVKADTPNDGRWPRVLIFAEGGEPVNHQNDIDEYDITLALEFMSDSDMDAAEIQMLRYMTAMIDTVRSDPRLNSTGIVAIDRDRSFHQQRGETTPTKHVAALGVEVRVHDP